MTTNARLDEFGAEEEDSDNQPERERSVIERLLDPISPALGLRVIPGQGDPVYLQNRGPERYLFRDAHERWFILQPSAKESVDDFVRWVYLPDRKPAEIARTAIRQRTVRGYRYVHRSGVPEPVGTTVTAMYLSEPWPDDVYECGSCGAEFELPRAHALHCWEDHPWVPNPERVRLRRSNTE